MSTLLDQHAALVSDEDRRLFALCDEIGDRIEAALADKEWTQRQLATALGKRESYVSRALSGGVNFTLRTIAQFEVALGICLLQAGADDERTPWWRRSVAPDASGTRLPLYGLTTAPGSPRWPAVGASAPVNDYASVTIA